MTGSEAEPDSDVEWLIDPATITPRAAGTSGPVAPNWRALAVVLVAFAAMLGVFVFGQSTGRQVPVSAPVDPIVTVVPEPTAEPPPTPRPEVARQLVDLIGEGQVVNELALETGGRVVLFCRETVPLTDISPMLTMIHFGTSPRHGEQLLNVEQLAKPRLASNSCAQCGGEKVTLNGDQMIVGSCVHGAPFSAGSVYVITSPIRAHQTPLALHLSCGITDIRILDDSVIIDAEAPLIRGLHQTRFPLPSIKLARANGEFVADDLELLNWNCDLFRSTQLARKHLLRDEPPRSISYDTIDSSIGPLGVHGPMVIGLTRETCSQLTDAWWNRPAPELQTGSPIAELIGVEVPSGNRDWFYTCQIEQ